MHRRFENDVEMYGTQTFTPINFYILLFENDVEMYSTQTIFSKKPDRPSFENDVKMYGTQTPQEVLKHLSATTILNKLHHFWKEGTRNTDSY